MEGQKKVPARAKGGFARAKSLSSDALSASGKKAAAARWGKRDDLPKAEYSGQLQIGEMVFPCSVLSDGTRVLTQSDFMEGMGMYYSGWVSRNRSPEDLSADVPQFLSFKALKPFVDKHLGGLQSIVLKYRTERGNVAHGIKAEIIPKICDVWLDADEKGDLGARQREIAARAKLMMRALAHVGIIALVDEATGYQEHRAKNALARILEEFIAKELQPYVETFPGDYYKEMFRLRGLSFPTDKVKRPQYFGTLTNDIIYKRLAPGVLEELKKLTPKNEDGRLKNKLFQHLTKNTGYPKLKEHLGRVIGTMENSADWHDFKAKLDKRYPRFDIATQYAFEYQNDDDDGKGL